MNKPNDKPRSAVAIQFRTKETLATTYKTWNNKPAIEEGAIGQESFFIRIFKTLAKEHFSNLDFFFFALNRKTFYEDQIRPQNQFF